MEKNMIEYTVQLKKKYTYFEENDIVISSEDAIRIISKFYDYEDREKLYVILINSHRKVIGINLVSVGTVDKVMMHPREIFKPAILLGAAAIIMVHNHPSGNIIPSNEDKDITNRIIECGHLLDIPLMDHIIYSEDNYYSLYDEMDKQ